MHAMPAILGVLPLRHGQIVQAKWIATALFAGAAALLLNGIPSLIYPIVSVGRLEANWLLILQLTTLQLTIGVLSGLLGFLVVLTVREGLLALLGARTFARISAAAQASLVVVGLLAFFLQPTFALRALRDGHPSARWWPAVVLAGTFEELGGHRVAAPACRPAAETRQGTRGDDARPVSAGAGAREGISASHRSRRARPLPLPGCGAVLEQSAAARGAGPRSAWDQGHEGVCMAPVAQRGTAPGDPCRRDLRMADTAAESAAPPPAGRGPGSRPGRWSRRLRPGTSARRLPRGREPRRAVDTGARGRQRGCGRTGGVAPQADSSATWLFAVAWNGVRAPYESGVALATWFILGLPVLLMAPLWWSLLGADAAITHAGVGLALALGLAELIVLTLGTLALVDDAIPSESARALPVLGGAGGRVGIDHSRERGTLECAHDDWRAAGPRCDMPRRPTLARLGGQPVMPAAGEPSVALSLNE